MSLKNIAFTLVLMFSLPLFAVTAKITPEVNDALVGIWSHDIANSNRSIVIEFKKDGSFDTLVYDRFNIKKYDVAVGKYLIQNNKIYTVIYGASGSKNYHQLDQIFESSIVSVSDDKLILANQKGKQEFTLISRRKFTLEESI